MNDGISIGKWILGVAVAIILLFALVSSWNSFTDVNAGEIAVFQYPTGTLEVVTEPGWKFTPLASVTSYRRSFDFSFEDNRKDVTNGIAMRLFDGTSAHVSGSVRADLPLDSKQMLEIHKTFGSQKSVEDALIKKGITRAVFATGSLLTAKESYSDKRNQIPSLVEDQAKNGLYQTYSENIETIDPLTKDKRIEKIVKISMSGGKPIRQEDSTISRFGVNVYNLSINGIFYEAKVEEQIAVQQRSVMEVQTAIANAKRAEQEKITTEQQGAANAAKAEWEQKTLNAQLVTEAEGRRKAAEQDKFAAEYKKQTDILLGEGESQRKKLLMVANGALDQKLEAYIEVNKNYAEALKGAHLVPTVVMGGGNGGAAQGNGMQFLELIAAKTARDMAIDFTFDKEK